LPGNLQAQGREGATEGMKPQVILEGFYLMLKFMT